MLHHYYQKPVYTPLTSLTKYCLTKQNHYFRSGKHQGDSWKIQGVNTEWICLSIILRTDVIIMMMMMIPFNLQNSETLVWPQLTKNILHRNTFVLWIQQEWLIFIQIQIQQSHGAPWTLVFPHPSFFCFVVCFFFFASCLPSFIKYKLTGLWMTYPSGRTFPLKWHLNDPIP